MSDVNAMVSVVDVDDSFLETVAAGRQRMFSSEQERVCRELIASRKRISELEAEREEWPAKCHDVMQERDELLDQLARAQRQRDDLRDRVNTLESSLQCPPVQKLATSGPSITRPVPAVDAWVTPAQSSRFRYRVSTVETVNGETHIISGTLSVCHDSDWLTGPSDRGPWRPIGEVK